jgi:hypothetical protein
MHKGGFDNTNHGAISMTDQERRQFSRILFDAWVELRQGDRHWHAEVVDLSLKGLLVRAPQDWLADDEAPFSAAIRLDNQSSIQMTVRLRHQHGDLLGFVCEQIDLDSVSNLRRLVELNLGDPELLERQLGTLGGA